MVLYVLGVKSISKRLCVLCSKAKLIQQTARQYQFTNKLLYHSLSLAVSSVIKEPNEPF